MHLRLAGYGGGRTQVRPGFADGEKWIKSTYSTKTPRGAIVGSAMATRELLNVRDTARALGVHENTVRNWEERGILRAVRLPGSGYRRFSAQDVERLRTEMFEQLAPAIEGPVVNPGRERTGRLVFGDATD
jgi:excisionase family DNA binding protein